MTTTALPVTTQETSISSQTFTLPADLAARLHEEARRHHQDVGTLLSHLLDVAEAEADRQEIIAAVRRSDVEVEAGRFCSLDEFIARQKAKYDLPDLESDAP